MKVEDDGKAASKIHKEEAAQIAVEWVREASDAREAKKLQCKLEKEDKQERAESVKRGEKEALRAAMEERRIMKDKAEIKKRREVEDAECAKRSVLDDIDETIKFGELCDKDDQVAKKVHLELQDELMAEDLARQESEDYAKYRRKFEIQIMRDTEKARIVQSELDYMHQMESKRNHDTDEEFARVMSAKLLKEENDMRASQEKEDMQYARKMEIKAEREAHRSKKATELEQSSKNFRTAGDVRRQWANADANIEDVSRGICISILLPFMRDLRVRVGRQQNVEIEAHRLLAPDERVNEEEEDGSCYIAEFIIDGAKSRISDECMSYEYSSVSGMLHVYIDNVHLEKMERSERKSMMSKLTSSFGRIFGKKNRAEAK
jgi:hypothetical protein